MGSPETIDPKGKMSFTFSMRVPRRRTGWDGKDVGRGRGVGVDRRTFGRRGEPSRTNDGNRV